MLVLLVVLLMVLVLLVVLLACSLCVHHSLAQQLARMGQRSSVCRRRRWRAASLRLWFWWLLLWRTRPSSHPLCPSLDTPL